jgi:hypothetical protein
MGTMPIHMGKLSILIEVPNGTHKVPTCMGTEGILKVPVIMGNVP